MSLQQSRSSRNSNIFLISSQSSRSSQPQPRPHKNYASFVRKVKNLLECDQDNLDQIYSRLEVIVSRYFEEHNIIEFREMYEHIAMLKTNSKKVNLIVEMLQSRLLMKNQGSKRLNLDLKELKEAGMSTSSTKKYQQNLKEYNRIVQSQDAVNTSIKYQHIFKPSFASPKDKKKKSRQIQVHRQNSSTESDYQNRNQSYNEKIIQLQKQLKSIKRELPSYKKENISNSSSLLLPELKENQSREQPQSQETIIDMCDQKNLYPRHSVKALDQAKVQKYQKNDKIKQNSQEYITSKRVITAPVNQLKTSKSIKEITQKQIKQIPSSQQLKNQNLLQITTNMTRQIRQLKQVASRLSMQSIPSVKNIEQKPDNHLYQTTGQNQENKSHHSITSILPQQKINQLIRKASQQKSKQPILQKMQEATSNHKLTDNMITSKQTQQIKKIQEQDIPVPSLQSFKQIPRHIIRQNSSLGSKMTNSYLMQYQRVPYQQMRPQRLETVKYSYNPYGIQNSIAPLQIQQYLSANKSMPPTRSFSLNQTANKSSIKQIVSMKPPITANNSTTSIMQRPLIMPNHSHLINPGSKGLIKSSFHSSNRSSLNFPQLNRPQTSPFEKDSSIVNMYDSSILRDSSLNRSTSSFRKKGLTLTTQSRE